MLSIFSNLLADANVGVIESSIFEHEMPSTTEQGVLIRATKDGIQVDPEIPDYYDFYLEIIVRAPTLEDGEQLSEAVQTTLISDKEQTITIEPEGQPIAKLNFVRPRKFPIVSSRTEGSGYEWNFDIHVNLASIKAA
jgi:hypothetical protein